MKINQKYIADLLNISRVTVTKALQNHPDIAKSTIEKVKKKAEELGYIPNTVGRSLSTMTTMTIGVIVPKINHSFFSTLIEEIYTEALIFGYQIILMVSFESEESEIENVRSLLSMNVDGLIIDSVSTSTKDKSYELIKKHSKPIVYIDRKPRAIKGAPGVFFDDYNLSYKLTKQLINKGYKDFMYITGPLDINICYERLAGFKNALQEENIIFPEDRLLIANLDKKQATMVLQEFLNSGQKLPEMIICANDSIALGVYEVCKIHNINIPHDIGVIGFGNIVESHFASPSLSTVKLNIEDASKQAIRKLVSIINKEDKDIQQDDLIDGTIIFRGSTK